MKSSFDKRKLPCYNESIKGEKMSYKKGKRTVRYNKKLYVYMAFVAMVAVHFFAKPFKKGIKALSNRLKKASTKNNLRAQLALGQHSSAPVQKNSRLTSTIKE